MAGNPSLYPDIVQESPAKRRKTTPATPTRTQKDYNSEDDSGDEIFDGYDTVATLPVAKAPLTQLVPTQLLSSSPAHTTQPTQLLDRAAPRSDGGGPRKQSIVQVAASSPLRPPTSAPSMAGTRPTGGLLANAMAPAGTAYRAPSIVNRPPPAKPAIIDLSDDDGPTYKGHSSDEDLSILAKADIKPSTFVRTGTIALSGDSVRANSTKPEARVGNRFKDFKEITSKAFYSPPTQQPATSSGAKRDADVLGNGAAGKAAKQRKQMGPARALQVRDISVDSITDFRMRENITKMRTILPSAMVLSCRDVLLATKGNYEDAMELLLSRQNPPSVVDITQSDDELDLPGTAAPVKMPAKRELKAPNRTIQDKWSSTQVLPRPQRPASPVPGTAPKPRKRLVRGRQLPSSPVEEVVKISSRPKSADDWDDSDSAIASSEVEDPALEGKVLHFFNTCAVKDLADISNQPEDVASVIISQRPFSNLDEIKAITGEVQTTAKSGKRRTTKKSIGEKIVGICTDMWTGYEAVDDLVTQCEALGAPVAAEMMKWGVDVYGAAKTGELELVSFEDGNASKMNDDANGQRLGDSGIGTPSSSPTPPSHHDQGDDIKDASKKRVTRSKGVNFLGQPAIMGPGVVLKDYQLVGLNWLTLLYNKGLSCILADEMGLGKTCQVIAFLGHLLETGVKGPHLVIVPGSTLENWLREFRTFCPSLVVEPYYGLERERQMMRVNIEDNLDTINVITTTYDVATKKVDSKFLRQLKPMVCVYDEGHALKNSTSKRYEALMKIKANCRLLLTGTPLQNNLKELAALLGFILPSVFQARRDDLDYIFKAKAKTSDADHSALLSAQRIARAKSMMTPFVLRRKKYQVLKHLPAKTCRIEYCDMTQTQWEIYNAELNRAKEAMEARAAGKKPASETGNVLMQLRKAAIHPMLFRRLFDDRKIKKMARDCLREDDLRDRNEELVLEDMGYYSDFQLHQFCQEHPTTMAPYDVSSEAWMDSGKVGRLVELLRRFRRDGDRALVFSQFTMVLDILQAVLETLEMQYFRFDGSTRIEQRQDMIDQFHDEQDVTVFLLSTKAGGMGINLACANKVVIVDQSFNPQEDIQAENRAHRVGQTREVEVIRLVSRGTVEEQINALGSTKLLLDDRVAGEASTAQDAKEAEADVAKVMEQVMQKESQRAGVETVEVVDEVL